MQPQGDRSSRPPSPIPPTEPLMTPVESITSETSSVRPLDPQPDLSSAEHFARFPEKDIMDRMVQITHPGGLTRTDIVDIYLEYGDV